MSRRRRKFHENSTEEAPVLGREQADADRRSTEQDAESEARYRDLFPSSADDSPSDAKVEAAALDQDPDDFIPEVAEAFVAEMERVTGGKATFKGGSGISYDGFVTRPPTRIDPRTRK